MKSVKIAGMSFVVGSGEDFRLKGEQHFITVQNGEAKVWWAEKRYGYEEPQPVLDVGQLKASSKSARISEIKRKTAPFLKEHSKILKRETEPEITDVTLSRRYSSETFNPMDFWNIK